MLNDSVLLRLRLVPFAPFFADFLAVFAISSFYSFGNMYVYQLALLAMLQVYVRDCVGGVVCFLSSVKIFNKEEK
tara:strand:+ start:129 stop:353 length:225 start_codon:yes stop_codon:yes gene_type:complete